MLHFNDWQLKKAKWFDSCATIWLQKHAQLCVLSPWRITHRRLPHAVLSKWHRSLQNTRIRSSNYLPISYIQKRTVTHGKFLVRQMFPDVRQRYKLRWWGTSKLLDLCYLHTFEYATIPKKRIYFVYHECHEYQSGARSWLEITLKYSG